MLGTTRKLLRRPRAAIHRRDISATAQNASIMLLTARNLHLRLARHRRYLPNELTTTCCRVVMDAMLADRLSHEPALEHGLLALDDYAAGRAPIKPAIPLLHRAARLALNEANSTGAFVAFRALGRAADAASSFDTAATAYSRALALAPNTPEGFLPHER